MDLKNHNGETSTGFLLIILIIAIIVTIVYFTGGSSIDNTVVSEDNYETISTEVAEKYGDSDETYYFSYACSYYIISDGFTTEYLSTQDESLLYQNIYGKTVGELIENGKDLMEENDITVDEWKETIASYSTEE